ncbi:MAG: GNAT family N-acetyltransferase [Hyphomicrobiales bacterium]
METIIPPVDLDLLEAELTEDKFVRDTNNGSNKIYIFDHKDSPNLLREVGRLREITFRDAGGGTGKACDIDDFDTADTPFQQLIVWNPRDKEIVGGYRFIHCKEFLKDTDISKVKTPTSRLFKLSETFIKDYLPHTIELGRSFVQPSYQPTFNIRKGMYSLDNIWDGLGAIVSDNPDVKYLFGKVTMYPHYDRLARDLVLHFLNKYFPDNKGLVKARVPIILTTDSKVLKNIFNGCNYEEDYRILMQKVRSLNENIPPLVNAYMNLSATMKTFGTAINDHFGNVEETGIIVTVRDIYDFKIDRHVMTYRKS